MAPAAVREGELVEPVWQMLAVDDDAQFIAHGEVRQAQSARRVRLGEEYLALLAVEGAPLAHAPLQGAQQRVGELAGVAALQFLEHGDGHQRWRCLQHGHHFAFPHTAQWVGAGAPVACWPLGGQRHLGFEPPCAAHADACFGCGCFLSMFAAMFFVFGHLKIRDAFAGHCGVPPSREKPL